MTIIDEIRVFVPKHNAKAGTTDLHEKIKTKELNTIQVQ